MHRTLISRFEKKLHMDIEVDGALTDEFCSVLFGAAAPHRNDSVRLPYRAGSPLLYHLDFVPGDDDRITKDLEKMFSAIRRAEKEGAFGSGDNWDGCLKAASIHMGIVKVYPYSEGFSELTARAALQYELVRAGFFPIDTGISETEYNDFTAAAIKAGEVSGFAGLLREAVYNKIDFFINAIKRGV